MDHSPYCQQAVPSGNFSLMTFQRAQEISRRGDLASLLASLQAQAPRKQLSALRSTRHWGRSAQPAKAGIYVPGPRIVGFRHLKCWAGLD